MDTVVKFISSLFLLLFIYLLFLIFERERERERERAAWSMETVVRFILWRDIDGMKMIYAPLTLFFLIYGM